MNLLFSRSQMWASGLSLIPLRIGGTVTFRLKAELELSKEELALARKYALTRATLISSSTYEDLAKAYRPAVFMGFLATIATLIIWPFWTAVIGSVGINPGNSLLMFLAAPVIGVLTMMALTVVYFFSLRKHVSVDQLMNGGRMFYCHSVVELDDREAELLDLCRRLYLTLEKAKNWGGREINPLPDGEPFYLTDPEGKERKVVLDRAMHQAGQVTKKLMTPFMVNNKVTNPPSSTQSSQPPVAEPPNPNLRDPNVPRSSPDHPLFGLLGGSDGTGWGDSKSKENSPPKPPSNPTPSSGQPNTPPPTQPNQTQKPGEGSSHPFAPKPPDDGSPNF